ncbi:MAG: pantetheine-phosphate adenylyltransferase [Bacilli bacterium]|nr:pantetheine-phosphate adenylyltransferase [Bacilli bacterium]
MKDKALFAGSFDPITNGHLDLIKRALKEFKCLTILVAINENKKPHYSIKKRLQLIKLATKGLNVKVDYTEGLTVAYAKRHHIRYLIRGVRNKQDQVYEEKMKKINQQLAKEIKTIIYPASKKYQNISSSEVVSLIKKSEDISSLVPKVIIKYL